jgi:hypothetical protein
VVPADAAQRERQRRCHRPGVAQPPGAAAPQGGCWRGHGCGSRRGRRYGRGHGRASRPRHARQAKPRRDSSARRRRRHPRGCGLGRRAGAAGSGGCRIRARRVCPGRDCPRRVCPGRVCPGRLGCRVGGGGRGRRVGAARAFPGPLPGTGHRTPGAATEPGYQATSAGQQDLAGWAGVESRGPGSNVVPWQRAETASGSPAAPPGRSRAAWDEAGPRVAPGPVRAGVRFGRRARAVRYVGTCHAGRAPGSTAGDSRPGPDCSSCPGPGGSRSCSCPGPGRSGGGSCPGAACSRSRCRDIGHAAARAGRLAAHRVVARRTR